MAKQAELQIKEQENKVIDEAKTVPELVKALHSGRIITLDGEQRAIEKIKFYVEAELKARGKLDLKKYHDMAELIRMFVRGAHGLTIDEKDIMAFLVNVEDIRERTRLTEHDVYGHSCMRLLADSYEELEMWGKIAEMEDHYVISEDGLVRNEAILMTRAKAVQQTTAPLTIEAVSAKPQEPVKPPEEQKKKGIFHR